MKAEQLYEETVVYYQSSMWPLGKNSTNTNYHFWEGIDFILFHFSYFFKGIQLRLSTPLHWEKSTCEGFSFDGVHWVFFCCQILCAKHIFSGSDHLQYLTTFVHQMSAW